MGTPLPANHPGDPCSFCWGLNETFGNGPTPRFITMTFSGYTPASQFDPNDEQRLLAPQLLIQQPNPCTYALQNGPILFFWRWGQTTALASIENTVVPIEYFRGDILEHCPTVIGNELTLIGNPGALGGIVTVAWSLVGLSS